MTSGPAGFDKTGQILYFQDSRDRNTSALFSKNLDTGDAELVAEDPRSDVGGVLAHPTEKTHPGGLVHLQPQRVEDPRRVDPGGPRLPQGLQGRRVPGHQPHAGRHAVDRGLPAGRRAGEVLPLRSARRRRRGGADDDLPVQQPRRPGRLPAGQDAHAGHQEPRRAEPGELPVAPARQRPGRRRRAQQAVADGARRPRRPLGPRRLGLQPEPPVAGQPRLRGAERQLPRLDRLRQELHQRRQRRVGRQDARRPDRRGRVGRRAGDRRAGQGRHHGRQLRRLRHAGRPDLHARRVRLRRRHRRAVEPGDAAGERARPTGRRSCR